MCLRLLIDLYVSTYVYLKWLRNERASMDRYLVYFLSNFMCGYDIQPRVLFFSYFLISWVFLEPYFTFSRFHVVLEHSFGSVSWEILVAYFMSNSMRGSGILLCFFERYRNPAHNFYLVPWHDRPYFVYPCYPVPWDYGTQSLWRRPNPTILLYTYVKEKHVEFMCGFNCDLWVRIIL